MKTIEQKDLLTSSHQAAIPDIDVDLLEVANQLASSATGLQKTALETKKPVFVSVRSLSKKLRRKHWLDDQLIGRKGKEGIIKRKNDDQLIGRENENATTDPHRHTRSYPRSTWYSLF